MSTLVIGQSRMLLIYKHLKFRLYKQCNTKASREPRKLIVYYSVSPLLKLA